MNKKACVVIIGGGSIGSSVAYNLARRGLTDIVLLEKGYLARGSTGRCAGGFRQQWGSKMNCLLSKGSVQIFERLSEELEYDIDFRQSGYLLLAYEKDQCEQLEKNLKLQNSLGIPSEKVSPQYAQEIVPYLNIKDLEAAFFCGEDGYVDPFKTTFAYAEAAQNLGVEINTFTTVTDIKVKGGKVRAVVTDKGVISSETVVNATGPYAKFIGQMVGLDHPVEPERHQALITEPLEPMLGPMVMSFHHNSYCQQVPHGGFVMGYGELDEPKGVNYKHGWKFIEKVAKKITYQLPFLKNVRVVRQWAGHYGISPDGQPILGEVPEIDGYYLALGCGKGFMLSPMIGKLIAECVMGEKTSLPIDTLSIKRFEKGDLIKEPAVV